MVDTWRLRWPPLFPLLLLLAAAQCVSCGYPSGPHTERVWSVYNPRHNEMRDRIPGLRQTLVHRKHGRGHFPLPFVAPGSHEPRDHVWDPYNQFRRKHNLFPGPSSIYGAPHARLLVHTDHPTVPLQWAIIPQYHHGDSLVTPATGFASNPSIVNRIDYGRIRLHYDDDRADNLVRASDRRDGDVASHMERKILQRRSWQMYKRRAPPMSMYDEDPDDPMPPSRMHMYPLDAGAEDTMVPTRDPWADHIQHWENHLRSHGRLDAVDKAAAAVPKAGGGGGGGGEDSFLESNAILREPGGGGGAAGKEPPEPRADVYPQSYTPPTSGPYMRELPEMNHKWTWPPSPLARAHTNPDILENHNALSSLLANTRAGRPFNVAHWKGRLQKVLRSIYEGPEYNPGPYPHTPDSYPAGTMESDPRLRHLSPEFVWQHYGLGGIDMRSANERGDNQGVPVGSVLNPRDRAELTYEPTYNGAFIMDPYRLVRLVSKDVNVLTPNAGLPPNPWLQRIAEAKQAAAEGGGGGGGGGDKD